MQYKVIKNKEQYCMYCSILDGLLEEEEQDSREDIELLTALLQQWDRENRRDSVEHTTKIRIVCATAKAQHIYSLYAKALENGIAYGYKTTESFCKGIIDKHAKRIGFLRAVDSSTARENGTVENCIVFSYIDYVFEDKEALDKELAEHIHEEFNYLIK